MRVHTPEWRTTTRNMYTVHSGHFCFMLWQTATRGYVLHRNSRSTRLANGTRAERTVCVFFFRDFIVASNWCNHTSFGPSLTFSLVYDLASIMCNAAIAKVFPILRYWQSGQCSQFTAAAPATTPTTIVIMSRLVHTFALRLRPFRIRSSAHGTRWLCNANFRVAVSISL